MINIFKQFIIAASELNNALEQFEKIFSQKYIFPILITQVDLDYYFKQDKPKEFIFVNTENGNDDNTGSFNYPVKTISRGVSMSTKDFTDVIVFNDKYMEQQYLELTWGPLSCRCNIK